MARKCQQQESTSFLKKRSKKLLSIGREACNWHRARWKKFFGSFFQKRTSFLGLLSIGLVS
jgi:hypothetical protein